MSMQAEREVPLLMQRKPVATLNEYTGKPVMKSALRANESAAAAAHEIPPGGGTKAARCAAYSAFTGVKAEFANSRFVEQNISFPIMSNGTANLKQSHMPRVFLFLSGQAMLMWL